MASLSLVNFYAHVGSWDEGGEGLKKKEKFEIAIVGIRKEDKRES